MTIENARVNYCQLSHMRELQGRPLSTRHNIKNKFDKHTCDTFFLHDYKELLQAIQKGQASIVHVIMKRWESDCFDIDVFKAAVRANNPLIQKTVICSLPHEDLFELFFAPERRFFSRLLQSRNTDTDSFFNVLFEQFSQDEISDAVLVLPEDDNNEPAYNLYVATCNGTVDTVKLFLNKIPLKERLSRATDCIELSVELFEEEDAMETCIFHEAMQRGPQFIAAYLDGMSPEQIEEFLRRGPDNGSDTYSFFHQAALTGNLDALIFFFQAIPAESRPQVPLWESTYDGTVLSIAEKSGNEATIQFLQKQLQIE